MASTLKVNEIQNLSGNTALTIDTNGFVAPKVPALSIKWATGTQTMTSNTWTAIDWSTHGSVELDNVGGWDSANERWTPSVAGWYHVNFVFSTGAGNVRAGGARVMKNGVQAIENVFFLQDESYGDDITVTASGLVQMNGTSDYMSTEGYCYDSVAGSDVATTYTRFAAFLVTAS